MNRNGPADQQGSKLKNQKSKVDTLNGEVLDGISEREHLMKQEQTVDMTQQKKIKEALKESEQMFRDLAEKSLAGIYLGQDGVFQYVNPALAAIMGYEAEELIGKVRVEDTVMAEDRAVAVERARKRASGEVKSVHHTFRIVKKDGNVRRVEAYGTITIYRGRPALLGTMLDITVRSEMEDTIRQAEEMYRGIFENATEGIFLTGPTHELVSINGSLTKIYGYDVVEELVKDLTSRKHGLFVSQNKHEEFFKRMHVEGYLRGFEAEQYTKDGRCIWVSFNLTPIKGADGFTIRHVGTVVDITERKKSEETLRRSEASLKALIGSMSDIIMLLNKKGKCATINLEHPELLTASLDGPFCSVLSEVIPGESVNTFLAALKRALKTQRTVHKDYRINTPNGEHWFSAAISPVTDELAISVSRDITHLKTTENELRLKTSTLEEMNNALKTLLYNMGGAKRELEENIVSNIRVLVMPHVSRLASQKLTDKEKAHLDAIGAGLKSVASPLLRDLSQFALTPAEIEIAHYVKDGFTTKEIIELMHGTKDSIDKHRYHIRKKLGLNKTNMNLRSYLLSFRQNI